MNLSKWTKEDLINILDRSGYGGDDIVSAKFAGVNDRHQAMFDIAFEDTFDGGLAYGKVYVFIDKGGELVADY